SSRRRHTRLQGDWSSDVCSSDLKRMIVVRIHVLNQQLAIALDDIERRSQVVAKSALKCFEIFGLPSGRRAIRGHALHERGQLDACAAHALEVRKHMIKL